jgi:hypothetical protein
MLQSHQAALSALQTLKSIAAKVRNPPPIDGCYDHYECRRRASEPSYRSVAQFKGSNAKVSRVHSSSIPGMRAAPRILLCGSTSVFRLRAS